MYVKFRVGAALAVAALTASASASAQTSAPQGSVLEGDTRLACEAVLCLSTGSRPSECTPSIQRYFSIRHNKPWKTLEARINFLNLCPASSQDGMPSLINAIANGAGMCDAPTLNVINRDHIGGYGDTEGTRVISNRMPRHCATYFNHPWTRLKESAPRYVGTPTTGGRWVEAAEFERALAQYKARMEAEARRREREQRWSGGN